VFAFFALAAITNFGSDGAILYIKNKQAKGNAMAN
jgi:hypothetical protein